jgi:hypothetical protein
MQFAVDGLARAEQVARFELHLPQQLAQLFRAERLDVIVDLLERDAALTEQAVSLSTFRSSRLFVNGDFVVHFFSEASLFGLWALAFGL